MADNESIHDDIREIRAALTTLVAQGARTEQMYVGLNERLYNGGTGAIPVLFTQTSAQKTAVEANTVAIKALASKVKEQRVWVSGIALGVTLALNGAKAGLAKFFHF